MYQEQFEYQKEVEYLTDDFTDYLHREGRLITRGKDPEGVTKVVSDLYESDDFLSHLKRSKTRLHVLDDVNSILDRVRFLHLDLSYWRLWFDWSEGEVVLELTFEKSDKSGRHRSECYVLPYGRCVFGLRQLTMSYN